MILTEKFSARGGASIPAQNEKGPDHAIGSDFI